jgi:hypothetical protein
MTVTICIGNSDNRLDQKAWSHFVEVMELEIGLIAEKMHFYGGPPTNAIRQNYAWVVDCPECDLIRLKGAVIRTRKTFGQDSAAWVAGETEMV